MSLNDVIDRFSGIEPGSIIDLIRNDRLVARENAQKSYLALFDPDEESQINVTERLAVAVFVATLHGEDAVAQHYHNLLKAERRPKDLDGALLQEAQSARGSGPYGHYPDGPLSVENLDGPTWRASDAGRLTLGPKISAALEHAHLLVLHPRDASREALQALLDAGWSATAIVTLSQVVAFLAFQIRVAAGLRTFNSVIASRRREAAE